METLTLDAEGRRQLASVYDGEQSNRPVSDDPATDERYVREMGVRAVRAVAEHFGCSLDAAEYAIMFYGV